MVRKQKEIMKNLAIITYSMLIIANLIALNLIATLVLDNLVEDGETLSTNEFQKKLFSPKIANNDTNAPIITFTHPTTNNSIITQPFLNISVNITDTNPPLPGNVTIQISNYTNILFNAKMNKTGEDLWSFNWDNISLYPNQELYILQVWAKDSSTNENANWSRALYILIWTTVIASISPLNFVLYLIVVGVIFAVAIVYINKKAFYESPEKKKVRPKGLHGKKIILSYI